MLQLVAGGLQPITNEVTVTMRFRLVENNEKEIVDFQLKTIYNIAEDLEKPSHEESDENKQSNVNQGISGLLNSLIISEYDAIDQYNSALATDQSLGVTDIIPILEDIVTEEHTHVGQLQAAVKLFDSAANAVEKGAEEAEDQLDTN